MYKEIQICRVDTTTHIELFYYEEGLCAGFPSPAEDYMEMVLDLNKLLIHNPSSTFFGKVVGNSLQEAEVYEGDILIIDKSLTPANGNITVCFIDGDFTLKFFERKADYVLLKPANKSYKPIRVTKDNNFQIWGVVTAIIKPQVKRW